MCSCGGKAGERAARRTVCARTGSLLPSAAAPMPASRRATDDLPAAMPPVSPTTYGSSRGSVRRVHSGPSLSQGHPPPAAAPSRAAASTSRPA